LTAAFSVARAEETRLLRFPAISGDRIVFSYAGDLYTVAATGGTARKLTSDPGYEMFSRFSPDGKQIAFTGQYDGNTEVFVIPADGGQPRRLTHTATLGRDVLSDRMGPNNIVMAWTPDGKNITYRSRKQTFNDFKGQLFNVPAEGGLSVELPLSEGGFCSYSPDGSKLAFNRVFREFRTWKRYKGGMADDVRIFDLKTGAIDIITDNSAQDIFPMWAGDEIFFLSDRDHTMNLFVYNNKTKKEEKVTDFKEFDVKFPSIGGDQIVFENGGYIYRMNVKERKPVKVPIEVPGDFIYARNGWKDAAQSVFDGSVSPDGKRVVFSARGEVFSVPAEKGVTVNMTRTPGVHERGAKWSPDGRQIAYLSDASGEFEIYVRDASGGGEARQLTKGADTYYFGLKWSPDSRKIAWNDRKHRLHYVDTETGKITEACRSEYGVIREFSWSPDSRWLTFSRETDNRFAVISLYNLETKAVSDVTDSWYYSGSPAFSADGKYLLFTSERDFNPIYSSTEWNHAYTRMERVYMALLAKDTPSPFAYRNDSVTVEKQPAKADAPTAKDKKTKNTDDAPKSEKQTAIDLDGIGERIISLPVGASNYGNLACVDGAVFYSDGGTAKRYDLKEQKETTLGHFNYMLAADNKKMLAAERGQWYVIGLPSGNVSFSTPIDLSRMKTWVDYAQEWKQIYDESWRQMRDFFYVENMHGVNWKAMHDKYAVLVPYVRHRDDLTYVIGELIGELSVGHAYVSSGQRPQPERIPLGLLGAKVSRDASGFFRIDRILKGANWSEKLRSPLTEPGMNIHEGDFITSVDGVSAKSVNDIYELLVGKSGIETVIGINSKPSETGARTVLVRPVASESALYYYNWVEANTRKVAEATDGAVGYLHIPDMSAEGLNEFAQHFYPQLNKKALIIDDRGNGGGNVSPMILERLRREAQRATVSRNQTHPDPKPEAMMMGPKILLMDRFSASDGDLFPWGFKQYKLGTVIGTRSWGGVIGISGSLPFMDGADLRKPEYATYSAEKSEWIIEGYGVDPDIVIDNDPHEEYLGHDTQLDKAIEVAKSQLSQYKGLPPVPKAPDKSK
jgi:tricorn protease